VADHLIRAMAWDERVRVVAGEVTDTVEELRRIHDTSPVTTAAIGRLATGALLLAATLEKVTGREPVLTVEVDGGGPAGRLMATASPAGWVRAMVVNPHATADPVVNGKLNVAGVVGVDGELAVTRDPGIGEPYRGVVPLISGEIARDIAHYLDDSEQTPAAVLLGVFATNQGRVGNAGGLMIQLLPGIADAEAVELSRRVRSLGPLTSRLLSDDRPVDWLRTLFPEGHRITEKMPARFLCGCTQERVETALKLMGAREIRALLVVSGGEPAHLTCEFCRSEYEVSSSTLSALLREIEEETTN
jgi:molecular chaperone Hsp33